MSWITPGKLFYYSIALVLLAMDWHLWTGVDKYGYLITLGATLFSLGWFAIPYFLVRATRVEYLNAVDDCAIRNTAYAIGTRSMEQRDQWLRDNTEQDDGADGVYRWKYGVDPASAISDGEYLASRPMSSRERALVEFSREKMYGALPFESYADRQSGFEASEYESAKERGNKLVWW